jgi:hypothetical protein
VTRTVSLATPRLEHVILAAIAIAIVVLLFLP